MEFNIDILKLGKADCVIIWGREDAQHYIVFLDGGEGKHADAVLQHYKKFISPHVGESPYLVAVNTHMHSDHLGGLQEIVETLQKDMKAVFFNNPSEALPERISMTEALDRMVRPTTSQQQFINESLDQARNFGNRLKQLNIAYSSAVSGISLLPKPFENYLRIIGPNPEFYRQMMRRAKQPWAMENADESQIILEGVGEDPCTAVADHQDASPYNKASVIIELITKQNKKYLFTADASAASFEAVLNDPIANSSLSGYHVVQLPHHGSWNNLDAKWAKHFGARVFWTSAPGGAKHPRHELVSCLKQTIPNAVVYSTHKLQGNWMRFTTNTEMFSRQTVPVQPL
jgi:hypothetical protein